MCIRDSIHPLRENRYRDSYNTHPLLRWVCVRIPVLAVRIKVLMRRRTMTVGMIGARKNTTKQHWEGKPTGSPDIERARQTDMIALAQQYTKLNRESVHEWSGPCLLYTSRCV